MTSHRIWIPSKQKYTRMAEINCEQYRNLLKVIDDDYEFEYYLKNILQENIYDKNLKINDEFTLIDKFVIFLQLKVHSCDHKLKLSRICEKCETKMDFSIDLNSMLDSLGNKIDRSFESVFNFNNITVVCDVPNIKFEEDEQQNKADINYKIDNYLYSFIKEIQIKNNIIDLNKLDLNQKFLICQNLPFEIVMNIKNNYVDNIHKIFQDLLIIKIKCSNEKCDDESSINFSIDNITDIIRILFKDMSAVSILSQYTNISTNCHFDYNFYKNICPAELESIHNMVIESNKHPDEEKHDSKEIHLFEDHEIDTDGMVETPSEFL